MHLPVNRLILPRKSQNGENSDVQLKLISAMAGEGSAIYKYGSEEFLGIDKVDISFSFVEKPIWAIRAFPRRRGK